MPKTIDFDAFRAEQGGEPLLLKVGGQTYKLPPSMPASLALDVVRLHGLGEEADVPPEELAALGAGLFGGEEKFRAVLSEGGVTMDELPDLLKQVLESYSGVVAPNRAARRERAKRSSASSRTGRSSRPTSRGSTRST